jgi:DNA-directed RNA polymerase subunit RPC12/RpoP
VIGDGTYLAPITAGLWNLRREEAMAKADQVRSGTYRCPVCGHRDTADLPAGEESMVITCSYCNTPLAVASRGPESIRFSVQVSEQPAAS